MGLISTSSILKELINLIQQQICISISMRALLHNLININDCRLIRYSFCTVSPCMDQTRTLNFELFFKEIQKSKDSEQAISIYKRYQSNSTTNLHYLAITMRILNRFLNFNNDRGIQASSQFIKNKIDAIKILRNQQISIIDLKDITIFLLDYTSANNGEIDESIKSECLYLSNRFLKMFKELQTHQKIEKIQTILTSMKSIGYYYSQIFEHYLDEAIDIFWKNKKEMINEGYPLFQFMNILHKFIGIISPKNIDKADSIAKYILQNMAMQSFQKSTIIAMLSCYYQIIEYYRHSITCDITNIIALVQKIQQFLFESFQKLTGKNIQAIIPIMLKYNSKAKLLNEFYRIIAKSINSNGQVCFNPLFILTAITYLNHFQYSTLVVANNLNFSNNLLMLLKRYYKKDNKYLKDIYKQLQLIIENRLFDHIYHLELLQYSIHMYRNSFNPSFKSLFHHHIKMIQQLISSMQVKAAIQSLNNLQLFIVNHSSLNKLKKQLMIPQQLLQMANTIRCQKSIKPITFNTDKGFILKQQLASICCVKLMFLQINMLYTFGKKDLVVKSIILMKQIIEPNYQNTESITEQILNSQIHVEHYEYFLDYLIQIHENVRILENKIIQIFIKEREAGKKINKNIFPFILYIFTHNQKQNQLVIQLFHHHFQAIFSLNMQTIHILIELCKQNQYYYKAKTFIYQIINHFSQIVFDKKQSVNFVKKCIIGLQEGKKMAFFNELIVFSCLKSVVESSHLSQYLKKAIDQYLKQNEINTSPQNYIYNLKKNCEDRIIIEGQKVKNIIEYNFYLNKLIKQLKGVDIIKQGISQQLLVIIKQLLQFSRQQMKPAYSFSLCKFLQKSGIHSKIFAQEVFCFQNNQQIPFQTLFNFYMRCPQLKNEQFFIRNFTKLSLMPNFAHYIHLLPYLISKPSLNFVEVASTHKLANGLAEHRLSALKEKIQKQTQYSPNNKGPLFSYKNKIKLPQQLVQELFVNTIFVPINYWNLEEKKIVDGPIADIVNRIIKQNSHRKDSLKEQTSVKKSSNQKQISVRPKWFQSNVKKIN